MQFEELKKVIDESCERIKHTSSDIREAELKASEFLRLNARLISAKFELKSDAVKLTSLRDAVYKGALDTAEGTNVTTKKINAESNRDYQQIREGVEYTENKIEYVKHYIDLFKDAHIFYRQLSKGD